MTLHKLKQKATKLRLQGHSYPVIEERLNVNRSTLSGWLGKLTLTSQQKELLLKRKLRRLALARKKAVLAHNLAKQLRLEVAYKQANEVVRKFRTLDLNILELALSFLYLGEGFKGQAGTAMGNSNPAILCFFITALEKIYGLDRKDIRCELHLRADQNSESIKKYWAKVLNISISQFRSVAIDRRTVGRPTFKYYKGVCVVRCGKVAIQRRLLYISDLFCEQIKRA